MRNGLVTVAVFAEIFGAVGHVSHKIKDTCRVGVGNAVQTGGVVRRAGRDVSKQEECRSGVEAGEAGVGAGKLDTSASTWVEIPTEKNSPVEKCSSAPNMEPSVKGSSTGRPV